MNYGVRTTFHAQTDYLQARVMDVELWGLMIVLIVCANDWQLTAIGAEAEGTQNVA